MSYFRRRGGLSGLGGAESCGPDQTWDPKYEFGGNVGQCMPRSTYGARAGCTSAELAAAAGTVGYQSCTQKINKMMAPASTSSSSGGIISSFLNALVKPAAPAPTTTVIMQQPAGMSTGTKLAIGGGVALLAVALIASRRS